MFPRHCHSGTVGWFLFQFQQRVEHEHRRRGGRHDGVLELEWGSCSNPHVTGRGGSLACTALLLGGSYPVHKGHAVHKYTKRNLTVHFLSNGRRKYADDGGFSQKQTQQATEAAGGFICIFTTAVGWETDGQISFCAFVHGVAHSKSHHRNFSKTTETSFRKPGSKRRYFFTSLTATPPKLFENPPQNHSSREPSKS
jgi:hypothetical protein